AEKCTTIQHEVESFLEEEDGGKMNDEKLAADGNPPLDETIIIKPPAGVKGESLWSAAIQKPKASFAAFT
ncbi:MAG: hypothetical protein K6C40_00555, partial [Thermoguttaceae bacterium]|nr:hypothetical protein [Thermoguttaceae bacterium]